MRLTESYDRAAQAYADHLRSELEGKPLDRHLLNRFAEEAAGRGPVVEVGCGPGQVGAYLRDRGVAVTGLDLSTGMAGVASAENPGLPVLVADMGRLPFGHASLSGIVAFYSIVHLEPAALPAPFREFRRVLAPGAPALVAFHVGTGRVHVEELFEQPVSLDFVFHEPGPVEEALRAADLPVRERVVREPYDGMEYPSRRCYLLARAC